jgi:hypothetical protein
MLSCATPWPRTTPLQIEYNLTEKGMALGDVLYSLAIFSIRFQPDEVFEKPTEQIEDDLRRIFYHSGR